jgi:peptidoglycan hydrolase-like protein with peptidoglycan-binding domain
MAVIQRPEAVGNIQEILNKLGYDSGDVDGMWGKDTSAGFNHFVHDVQAHVFADKPEERDGFYGAKTHEALKAQVAGMYGDRLTADEIQRLTDSLAQMTEKVGPDGKPHPLGRPVVDRLHTPQPLATFESKITPRAAESAPVSVPEEAPAEISVEAETSLPEVLPVEDVVSPVATPKTPEEMLDAMADIETRQAELLRVSFFGTDPEGGASDERVNARVENMRDPEKFEKLRTHLVETGNTQGVAALDEFKALEEERRGLQSGYEAAVPAADVTEATPLTPDQRINEAFAAASAVPVDPELQAALERKAAEMRVDMGAKP